MANCGEPLQRPAGSVAMNVATGPRPLTEGEIAFQAQQAKRSAMLGRFLTSAPSSQAPRVNPKQFGIPSYGPSYARTGFGGLAETYGILPTSEWPKADAAVKAAWDLYYDLKGKLDSKWFASDDVKGNAYNALTNFGHRVQSWSETLEKLKHDPGYGKLAFSSPRAAIDAWKAWSNDSGDTSFAQWARQIDSAANFGTIRGAAGSISSGIAADTWAVAQGAAQAVRDSAGAWAGVIRYLPYIAVGVVGLMGVTFALRLSSKVPSFHTPPAPAPAAPVSGLTRRRRRRSRR